MIEKKNILFFLPNTLSFLRLLSTPYVIYLVMTDQFKLASYIVLAACLTDWADGFLARLTKSVSNFGAFIDPIADKVLICGLSVALYWIGFLPLWLLSIFVIRDFLLITAGLFILLRKLPVPLNPIWISKVNTFAQMAFLLMILWFKSPMSGQFYLAIYNKPGLNQDFLLSLLASLTTLTTLLSTFAYLKLFRYHKNK